MTYKSKLSDLIIKFYKMVQTQFGKSIITMEHNPPHVHHSKHFSQRMEPLIKQTVHITNEVVEKKRKHLFKIAMPFRFQSNVLEYF